MATTSDPTRNPAVTSDDATAPGSTGARIEKLAQRWKDLQDNGQNVSVEFVCADFPELTPAVRDWIAKFGKMEALLATQAPSSDTLRGSWSPDNVLAAPQGPDELGRLGGYRVLKLIGQGGMGKVYLAEDLQLKRRVALKILLKGGDQRFLREAQTLAAVEHDHIVLIYQIGEDRGTQYLAMPYLQGETLEKRLKTETRLPLAEAVRITKQITQGLAAAHQRGVIHRDIKPSNVWLEAGTDRVKILDFGLARSADAETMLTQEGAVLGTPAFMAPEQAQGNSVDHRADLFSLGCVLYQMISGVSPFARKDVLSTLRALELETPELPTVRYPDTPGPLADLAMKLLEKKPDNRPSSAQAVLETLQAIETDMATGTSAATTAISARNPTLREGRPQATTATSRRAFPMIPAVIVAGCLVAAAYYIWSQQSTNPSGTAEKPKDEKSGVVATAPITKKDDVQPNPVDVKPNPLPVADLFDEAREDFKINIELLNVKAKEDGVHRLVEGPVRFKIEVDQDAYVGIWFKADDGSTKQFFPNEFDRDNHFQKGKVYEFPRNKDYTLEATPSTKVELFRVIATTKPWSWDPTNAQQGYRTFRDTTEFNENLRGVVLKANPNNSQRVSQASMPVWVLPK